MTYLWTHQAERELERLWKSGKSASVIGRLMGCGKNAVSGKIDRLRRSGSQLQKRPSPIVRLKPDNTYVRYLKSLRRPRVVTREQSTRDKIETPKRVERRVPGGTFKTCQWPRWGDNIPIADIRRLVRAGELHHCGAPSIENSSYCSEHVAEASGGRPARYEL